MFCFTVVLGICESSKFVADQGVRLKVVEKKLNLNQLHVKKINRGFVFNYIIFLLLWC